MSAFHRDQLQPYDSLDDDPVADVLDEGYSPPEKPQGVNATGVTEYEQEVGETLDERISHEEPDPAAEELRRDPVLGVPGADEEVDDDDVVDFEAEDDPAVPDQLGGERAGRLVEPDEGAMEDTEKDMVARDVGVDGAAASAEEAAMHVVDERDLIEDA